MPSRKSTTKIIGESWNLSQIWNQTLDSPSSRPIVPRDYLFACLIIFFIFELRISTSWKNIPQFLAPASVASCLRGVGDTPSVAGGYFFMGYTIQQINSIKPSNSRVTALRFAPKYTTPKGASYTQIVCRCRCGVEFTTLLSSVTQGKALSCGCLHKEVLSKKGFTIQKINDRIPINSRLTAISFNGIHITAKGQKVKLVNVKCSCGKKCVKRQPDILCGHTLSCGCYEEEVLLKRNTKYSHNIPKLYHCWNDMMRRCYDQKSTGYLYYGGRGVSVCEDWHDYQKFLDWALMNGWEEGLQLDKDKKGDGLLYCPDFCCFLTPKENNPHNMKKNKP